MLNNQLITDALREIGVIDAYTDPNAEDSALGLRKLNALMATLKRVDTIDLGYFPQEDVSAELPLSDDDAALVMPILAMAMTINFPAAVIPPTLPAWAQECHNGLLNEAVKAAAKEQILNHMSLGSAPRGYNIFTGQ